MAKPSSGTIQPHRTIIDANQAMAILDTVHHWHATRVNSSSRPPSVQITVTHAGRRVSANRRTFVEAVNAVMQKLSDKDRPKFRLTIGDCE